MLHVNEPRQYRYLVNANIQFCAIVKIVGRSADNKASG